MATMRNGLETWLKQECADMGTDFSVADNIAVATTHALLQGNLQLSRQLHGGIGNLLAKYGIDDELKRLLADVSADINTEDSILAVSKMVKAARYIHKLALERVVECQCGKPGSKPIDLLTKKLGRPPSTEEWVEYGEHGWAEEAWKMHDEAEKAGQGG